MIYVDNLTEREVPRTNLDCYPGVIEAFREAVAGRDGPGDKEKAVALLDESLAIRQRAGHAPLDGARTPLPEPDLMDWAC